MILNGTADDGVKTAALPAAAAVPAAQTEMDKIANDVEQVYGSGGADRIDMTGFGGAPTGGVSILGFAGKDFLIGTAGADFLDGGAGTDNLNCDLATDISSTATSKTRAVPGATTGERSERKFVHVDKLVLPNAQLA